MFEITTQQDQSCRTSQRTIRLAGRILLLAGLTLALPSLAIAGRGHGGKHEPGGWVEKHAEQLGLDEATRAEIDAIVESSRPAADALHAEDRATRDALHGLLDQNEPDFDAVMRQAEVVGEVGIRKRQHRLKTMLAIRAKLTPEQRSQLRELDAERREHKGKRRHGHHGDHEKGSCGDDGGACECCGHDKGACGHDGGGCGGHGCSGHHKQPGEAPGQDL